MKKVFGWYLFLASVLLSGGIVLAAEQPVIYRDGHKIVRYLKTADFGSNVLAKAVLGEAAKREVLQANFSGTISDSATLKRVLIPGRAGTIKGVDVAALVKPVGGTNTLKVEKVVAGSPVTVLNAASFDPTAIAADGTAEALTLTSTSGSLAFTAADLLVVTLATGTQSTDAQDLSTGIEVEYNDTP